MSTQLERHQARLTKVQAAISNVEEAYPTIAKVRGYSKGFGAVNVQYQEFGAVGREYRRLMEEQEWLESEIEALSNGDEGGSVVVSFRGATS